MPSLACLFVSFVVVFSCVIFFAVFVLFVSRLPMTGMGSPKGRLCLAVGMLCLLGKAKGLFGMLVYTVGGCFVCEGGCLRR